MNSLTRQRIALSAVFFQSGICFSSWASRIPDIKQIFELTDYTLGLLLLIKPLASLFVGLPLASWAVDRFGSRVSIGISLIIYSASLVFIGLASSLVSLGLAVFCFGVASNLANVSVNTHALALQKSYGRVIMASFHGLWSLAGFCGAGLGALAIAYHISIPLHFVWITTFILMVLGFSFYGLRGEDVHAGARKGFTLRMPDEHLLKLGAIAFCGLVCEGCMYDWSGIYFKDVVGARAEYIIAGFIAFMGMMATGRFISDRLTNQAGTHRVLQASGVLIFTGLITAVLFPYFITGIIGFLLVGLGTSSVIPLTYSEVGKSTHVAPGMAISIVSTIGYFGFLLGPPVIGFIAGALNLRASFTLVAIAGLCISILITRDRRKQRSTKV